MRTKSKIFIGLAATVLVLGGITTTIVVSNRTIQMPIGTTTPKPTTATPEPVTDTPATMHIVALGDSMSIASNSCGDNDSCPTTSWISGTGTLNSITQRVTANTSRQVKVENYAHIGDKADALTTQVPLALAAHPDLVTILIGANDVCAAGELTQMTSTATYGREIRNAITQIHANNPTTRILLASVPDPTKLWQALNTNAKATHKWGDTVCAVALKPGTDPASDMRRAAVTARVNAYNITLAKIAAAQPQFVHYDGGAVNTFPYSLPLISKVDYLHPNQTGQHDIAAAVWASPGTQAFLLDR